MKLHRTHTIAVWVDTEFHYVDLLFHVIVNEGFFSKTTTCISDICQGCLLPIDDTNQSWFCAMLELNTGSTCFLVSYRFYYQLTNHLGYIPRKQAFSLNRNKEYTLLQLTLRDIQNKQVVELLSVINTKNLY